MGKGKKVIVTDESDSGRNRKFLDTSTGAKMTRGQFNSQINKGDYPDYYTRDINGLETPVSKPDGKENNNLG